MTENIPFWRRKTLSEMTKAEWESLCDGCGLCCLHKLEDEDSGVVAYTTVACRLLDCQTCRCQRYAIRQTLVPDCVMLSPDQVTLFAWLPKSCAYRLISEGQDLKPWHPLVSQSSETVHSAGISVRGRVINEQEAGDLVDYIMDEAP